MKWQNDDMVRLNRFQASLILLKRLQSGLLSIIARATFSNTHIHVDSDPLTHSTISSLCHFLGCFKHTHLEVLRSLETSLENFSCTHSMSYL